MSKLSLVEGSAAHSLRPLLEALPISFPSSNQLAGATLKIDDAEVSHVYHRR